MAEIGEPLRRIVVEPKRTDVPATPAKPVPAKEPA
jgi:hypothetical protein